tara:strand:- start:1282 stop:1884 length:603 start_codon:yes stop_codon:yes gene_type:complete
MLIGFFIEPDQKLKKIIINYKRIVKKNFGNQIYLSHPAHLTLLTMSVKRKLHKNKIIKITKFIKNFKNIKIKISKIKFFFNDPQTKCHTMFFSLKKNTSLNNFQMKLISFLNQIIESKNIVKKDKFDGKLKKDYRRYGYPYVGKNWIPHFTISSISKKHNLEKIQFLIKKKISLKSNIKKISIWSINKDQHKKLHTLSFK